MDVQTTELSLKYAVLSLPVERIQLYRSFFSVVVIGKPEIVFLRNMR
jgi:hypothetical protein